ncbi:MAG: DMT family transporter [Saprospiraceae bacterium]|jgi:drug/metabolite transporter (DMT)-like permease
MNIASNRENQGIFYMLIASFSFALTGACARYLRDDINPVQLVFFRNLIGVGFILYSMWKVPVVQIGGKPWVLLFRGVIGTLALYSFFYGISNIGLAISITYQQSYPVFLSLFAAWYFKEKLNVKEWVAVFLGFFGICLIFIPSVDISLLTTKHHLVGLSNALMTGMAYLSIRELSQFYDQRSIILSFMASGIVLPVFSMLLGQWMEPGHFDFLISDIDIPIGLDYIVILLMGLAALIGQIYLTKAFSYQKTGVIAAVGYSNIVFSVILGTFLGDAFPDALSLSGIFLIIICGVMISFNTKPK